MKSINRGVTAVQRTIVLACLVLFCSEILGAQVVEPPKDVSCGIHSPSQTYSAQEIDTMFDRPRDLEHLLRNLKVAMDKDLFVQAGFYTDANLMKLFNGTHVTWSTPSGQGQDNTWRLFKVTTDPGVFPGMTVELLRSCRLEPAYTSASGAIPAHVRAGGSVTVRVESVPGFTVDGVRRAFGTETQNLMESDAGPHGRYDRTIKGSLNYERRAHADIERNSSQFVIKIDSLSALAQARAPGRSTPITKSNTSTSGGHADTRRSSNPVSRR
jgi:hypothetical protein